jgi:hypothetical protein
MVQQREELVARFYIGQPVRCIKGWPSGPEWLVLPKLGERYTVKEYDTLRPEFLGLNEVPSNQTRGAGHPVYLLWAESHFAPITDEKVLEIMRVALGWPLRVREREDA